MKFDFRRLTPALVTSLALIFFALLCASIGWTVFAWLVGLAGLVLNVVGLAVVQIDDSQSPASGDSGESKTGTFAHKTKNARAALRDSASRASGKDSGTGSASGAKTASGSKAPAGGKTAADSQESQTPKVTKRF
ncbi:hypothetical protein [Kocuria sp.]|uniref:hypothetical protein n=1 Tax=Kocuria sp. TaxID=1871328 RepID=UPI0026DFB03A|nr:hypothetical protein [Kocuria sp.]MDO5619034.1 hypothetical protein [Kocuria sp.]